MRAQDPRWIILLEEGAYATVGRHRQPDVADIEAAEQALARAGTAGWLAVLSQSVHSPELPEIVMVRPLCRAATAFEDARQAFLQRIRSDGAS